MGDFYKAVEEESSKAFMQDLIAVFEKHQLCIVPSLDLEPDFHDSMIVIPYEDEDTVEYIHDILVEGSDEDDESEDDLSTPPETLPPAPKKGDLRVAALDDLLERLLAERDEAIANREQTIKNWEADIRAMNANRETYKAEIAELKRQAEVAREGLEWYAKDETWYEYKTPEDQFGLSCLTSAAEQDEGTIARDTLARMNKEQA